jgi:glycosyltransferase involved in cell wall biosynthesis
LVNALRDVAGKDFHIDILTTMPNRYQSLSSDVHAFEDVDGLLIRRIPLPPHQSGMADQARAFWAFARGVLRETRGGKWDVVIATSSRLMTAALGARIAKHSGSPLYLDMRDLFTDTMSDLLKGSALRVLLSIFRKVESLTLNSASRVNIVSSGFLDHVQAIAPQHEYRLFTNGIDDEFFEIDFSEERSGAVRLSSGVFVDDLGSNSLPLVLYAGNMGEGQGLHNVLPKAAKLLESKARIRLIGDGGRRVELKKALREASVSNVELLDPVPRSQLYAHYREADILFLHLNDHPAFLKVLPSKLFEYAAIGKPVLAGVAGYAADFIRQEIAGAEVFNPCDAEGMAQAFERLLVVPMPIDRTAFCAKYARKSIMREMAKDILALRTA